MRALLSGQRVGNLGVVLGLTGVICLLIASMGLNWKQSRDLHGVKTILTSRCEARQQSDDRTREDLQGRIDLYASIVAVEQVNPYIDDQLRARRIAPYRKAMDAAQAALDGLPRPVDCAQVYAAP